MLNGEPQDLKKQLECERERVKQLEEEREELLSKMNLLENYKPFADAWLREHMPSKEECEKELLEMLAHPENLVDFGESIAELLRELQELEPGEHAA